MLKRNSSSTLYATIRRTTTNELVMIDDTNLAEDGRRGVRACALHEDQGIGIVARLDGGSSHESLGLSLSLSPIYSHPAPFGSPLSLSLSSSLLCLFVCLTRHQWGRLIGTSSLRFIRPLKNSDLDLTFTQCRRSCPFTRAEKWWCEALDPAIYRLGNETGRMWSLFIHRLCSPSYF